MSRQPLTDTTFESFGLDPRILSGLAATGFTRCTPIQALSLPIALQWRDVAGQAQTGTGKTGAFLVAIMQRLLTQPARPDRRSSDPRALVIAPTRELAIQIDKDFQNLGRDTGLVSALIYGGVDYDKQREALRSGCDLIIATPGRLIDYLKQQVFSLGGVEVLVIDEADRMFDLGFIKDIRFLLRRMPPRTERQNLLYSATLSHRVLELAYEHMNEPEKLVAEAENVTADRVRQQVFFPAREEKMRLLGNLLARIESPRGIVFVNTRAAAERVSRDLERLGYAVATLSGDVPQARRERLLGRFKQGEIELLVATDVAARGLHIDDVGHVFNYDLPQDAEDYVHRIGRTARLGAEGDAVSFACDLYAISLPEIEEYIGQKIPVSSVDPELLARVAPRPRRSVQALTPEEEAADAARNTAGPPMDPSASAPDRRRAPRREPGETASADAPVQDSPATGTRAGDGAGPRRRRRGGRGRGRSAGGTAAPASQGDVAAQAPAERRNVAAAGGAAPGEQASADGAPRKRHRRGGRGRKRSGQPGQAGAAPATVPSSPGGTRGNGQAKPEASRPAAPPQRERPQQAGQQRAAPEPGGGLLRRIARFFGQR